MIVIRGEFTAGSEITRAVGDAKDFAVRNGCGIKFDFNGVSVTVYPGSDCAVTVDSYHQELSRKAGARNE